MENAHLNWLKERYPDVMEPKNFVVLHIPDDYEFMQPELVDELAAKVPPFLQSFFDRLEICLTLRPIAWQGMKIPQYVRGQPTLLAICSPRWQLLGKF